jgi:hypothetical protein
MYLPAFSPSFFNGYYYFFLISYLPAEVPHFPERGTRADGRPVCVVVARHLIRLGAEGSHRVGRMNASHISVGGAVRGVTPPEHGLARSPREGEEWR